MIENFKDFVSLNEGKIELVYKGLDSNGRLLYIGSNGLKYVDVEGEIHSMSRDGEPQSPISNVFVKKGEIVYNPEDRFNRKLGSKIQESVNPSTIKENGRTYEVISTECYKDICYYLLYSEKYEAYTTRPFEEKTGIVDEKMVKQLPNAIELHDTAFEARKELEGDVDKLK